jgi:hypothetical protein
MRSKTRALLFSLACIPVAALVACNTSRETTQPTIGGAIGTIVNATTGVLPQTGPFVDLVRTTCSFLPEGGVADAIVQQILATYVSPTAADWAAEAKSFCSVVKKRSSTGQVKTYRGVEIRGQFVR